MKPLVPDDLDLTDFEFMPVEIRRLLKSETWSLGTSDERAAAIALWFESWHQVPAGSLPDNDRMLARLADCRNFRKVKGQALRGWVSGGDGRLYHPVVCEKALEAWLEKLGQRLRSGAGNAKRWKVEFDAEPIKGRIREARQYLTELNPDSRALLKWSQPVSPGDSKPDSEGDPQRLQEASFSDPSRMPQGSQGTGTGTGTISSTYLARDVEVHEVASALARALRAAGFPECSDRHPDLLDAAREGITPLELEAIARQKPGKGIPYLVKAARGRRQDAATAAGGGAPAAATQVVDAAAVKRAEAARKLEDELIEIRHKCDVLGMFTPEERDRLIAEARARAAQTSQVAA